MKRRFSWPAFLVLQLAVAGAFGAAYGLSSARTRTRIESELRTSPGSAIPAARRSEPLRVEPLYDRPDLVSDEELAAVLDRVVPRFNPSRTKPNFVEHALRIWSVEAEFADPQAMSGRQMQEFLTDHARYAASWGDVTAPLLHDSGTGIAVRWGRETGASVHHDHWLASLTEAGARIGTPVYGPGRRDATIADVLQESLRDFRLDERETEWTAMAFGLWLPPTCSWIGADGREYSFDLLVRRLLRGHKNLGVCSGTHRVYSLMLLWRLNEDFDILSNGVADDVYAHLEEVRDLITAAQWEDGRWPSNWAEGAEAAAEPIDEEISKQVIATGHHLEWLAIAPRSLHPPDAQIQRAARWIIDETTARTAAQIMPKYTFYSHVGGALALWRSTRPDTFWQDWRRTHPFERTPENTIDWDADPPTGH
jgi:hypothetical protein